MTDELVALLDGNEVGCVRNDARGRLTFVYDSVWRGKPGAYPLALDAARGRRARPCFRSRLPVGTAAGQ
jgi:hypothetical protein